MHTFFPTRLQTLYWEIKCRSFYILFSFFITFLISYHSKQSLIYLFGLSYLKSDPSKKSLTIYLESLYDKNLLDFILRSGHKDGREIFYDRFIESESFSDRISISDHIPKSDGILALLNKKQEAFLSFFMNESARRLPLVDLFDDDKSISLSVLSYIEKVLNGIDISSISFIFTDVEEAFFCTISICFIFSFMAIIPFLIYQSFCFLLPSLHLYETRKWVGRAFGVTVIWYCFIINLCYNLIPKLADFLLCFEISTPALSVVGQTKIYSYLIWTISLVVATSLIYFFFCFIFFLIINGKLKVEYFTTRRSLSRGAIVLLSAFLAPPEIQFFLALLLFFCFEALMYFFFFYKNLKAKKASL